MAGIFGWNPFKSIKVGDQAKKDVRRAVITAAAYAFLRSGFGNDLQAQNLARKLADAENTFVMAWGQATKMNLGDVVTRWFLGQHNLEFAADERRAVNSVMSDIWDYMRDKGQLDNFLQQFDIQSTEI